MAWSGQTRQRVAWWLISSSSCQWSFLWMTNSANSGGLGTIMSVFIVLSQLTPINLLLSCHIIRLWQDAWRQSEQKKLILKIYISAGKIMQSFLSVLMILTADTLSWLCSSLTLQYSRITCFYWIVANQSKSARPFPSFSCSVYFFLAVLQFWGKANNFCLVRHKIQLFPWNCQMRKYSFVL